MWGETSQPDHTPNDSLWLHPSCNAFRHLIIHIFGSLHLSYFGFFTLNPLKEIKLDCTFNWSRDWRYCRPKRKGSGVSDGWPMIFQPGLRWKPMLFSAMGTCFAFLTLRLFTHQVYVVCVTWLSDFLEQRLRIDLKVMFLDKVLVCCWRLA